MLPFGAPFSKPCLFLVWRKPRIANRKEIHAPNAVFRLSFSTQFTTAGRTFCQRPCEKLQNHVVSALQRVWKNKQANLQNLKNLWSRTKDNGPDNNLTLLPLLPLRPPMRTRPRPPLLPTLPLHRTPSIINYSSSVFLPQMGPSPTPSRPTWNESSFVWVVPVTTPFSPSSLTAQGHRHKLIEEDLLRSKYQASLD